MSGGPGGGGRGLEVRDRALELRASVRASALVCSGAGEGSRSVPPPPSPAHDRDEPSRLALAYQAGDRSVLEALHRSLRPIIASALGRYPDRPGVLPSNLDRSDLLQESWLILADLAERWDPAGGAFGAYVRVSFPWAIARYVRHHSPSRRARGVVVVATDLPDVQEKVEAQPGVDGREWDVDIAWTELLEHLSPDERAVLMLHLGQEQTFTDVARALRITRPSAFRLYRRALKRVQASPVRVGARRVVIDAAGLNLRRDGELVEVVHALHRGARRGRLPGRDWVIEQTGLSERRVTRFINLLVEADCVRGRSHRRTGQLVYRTPEETLAVLGVRPDDSASEG